MLEKSFTNYLNKSIMPDKVRCLEENINRHFSHLVKSKQQ